MSDIFILQISAIIRHTVNEAAIPKHKGQGSRLGITLFSSIKEMAEACGKGQLHGALRERNLRKTI